MSIIIGSASGSGKGPGGAGGTPTEAKDNLDSKQFAKVLDLLAEGEIEGLVDGAKSIYLNNTPLQDVHGAYNFKDVTYEVRTGTSNQTSIPITVNTETTKATGLSTIVHSTPGVVQITDSEVDAVKVIVAVPTLQEISDKGDIFGTEVEIEIQVQYSGGSYATKVSGASGKITGRSGDLYAREYLINLDGAFPVNIKLKRITADSTSSKLTNAIQWNNYVEIKYDNRSYPNSALVGIRVDAEQFTSIPTRKYRIKGLKVQIPHNATVRADGSLSYSGTFNGTLGAAQYTNDPAWCLYSLLTSSRFGLGDHLEASELDKFSFYSASQYCSTQVDDGTGTGSTEPRFAISANLQTQQEAYNVVNQMCSVFRAMPYWAAGSLEITQDSPADASYLFTLANVLPPGFTYSNTNQRTRPTVVVVKYLDLELMDVNYEEVIDSANLARYGRVVKNIDAFGTTSRGQANRLGKWLLYEENVEKELVNFTTSVSAGVIVRPGQVIEIADEMKSGTRRGGRIKSGATTTAVPVDDITGISYTVSASLSVELPDGSVEKKTVSGVASNVISVVGNAFSAAPNENSMWVYETTDIESSQWRVLTVDEQDRTTYAITANEYHSGKYQHIESNIALVERDITNLDVPPPSPSGLVATETIYENTGIARVKIILSWTSDNDNAFVRWRYENGNWVGRTIEGSKSYEILDTVDGNYRIEVYNVSASGLRSVLPAQLNPFVAEGKTALPQQVTGVSLLPIDEASAILSWNRATELDVLLGGKTLIRFAQVSTGATWQNAQEIGIVATGSQTQKQVPLIDSGSYLLKFEDDGGRRSGTPGSSDSDWNDSRVTIDFPAPSERLLIQTIDEHTANFAGTDSNTEFDASLDALKLTVTNNATAASGEYTFANAVNLTQSYSVNVRRNLKASGFFLNSLWDTRTDLIDSWGLIDSIGSDQADKVNCNVYLRTSLDNSTWTTWREFTNVLVKARHIQFKAKLTCSDTNQNIKVTELGAVLELQGRTESISTPVTTGSSAYTVTFIKAFKNAPNVAITPTSQQTGDFYELANITRTGFQVTFKNGSSAVARPFVWAASGFGKEVT